MGKWVDRLAAMNAGLQVEAQTSGVAHPSQWFTDWAGGTPASSGLRVNPSSALASAPIAACVKILAEDIAKLPVKLYKWQLQAGGGRSGGRTEIITHPVWQLLALRPNRWMTAYDFRAAMVSQYCLNGNAIAVIRRENGRPVELIPVETPQITLYVAPNAEIWYEVSFLAEAHRYLFDGSVARFAARDVLHVKWPITYQGLWGLSPISMAREAIGNALAVDQYAGRLFANNADVGGVITRPATVQPMSEEAMSRFKRQWDDRYSGIGNRGKTPILQEGMGFEKLAMTAEDAQFILARKFSVLEAARIWRIPPYKLADLDRTISSNIVEQSRSYADDTLVPIIANFEAEYTEKLLVAREWSYLDIEHDLTAFLRGQADERMKLYATAIEHGVYSPNEVRIMEGQSPRDSGDTYYYSNNMQPDWRAAAAADPGGSGEPGRYSADRRHAATARGAEVQWTCLIVVRRWADGTRNVHS